MRFRLAILSLLAPVVLAGCAVEAHAGFESAADATATAVAQAHPTSVPPLALGKVAYIQGGDVWTKQLPDGKAYRLTQDGGDSWPLWSPSGTWLAFIRDQALWTMRADGGDAHSLGPVAPGEGQVEWSVRGDRLAYISDGGLILTDADGSREVRVVSGGGGEGAAALAWSPDGAWLAYEAEVRAPGKPPMEQGLWRVRADGTGSERISLSPAPAQIQYHLAGWSPDASELLYWQGMQLSASLAADGEPLMAISLSGGSPHRIVPIMLPYRSFLAWSPDGRTLAVVAGGGRQTWANKVLLLATLHGAPRRLTNPRTAMVAPAWSPEGHTLAVAIEIAGPVGQASTLRAVSGSHLWIVPANGPAATRLTSDPSFADDHPQWSRDGSTIVFARIHGQRAELWLVHADETGLRQIVAALTPSPLALDYYGHIPWGAAYDYWTGSPPASSR
ncbi:MAG TPA: hypothetical protein VFB58_04905 [Chloroflexota bacterium]|nr:hypothetical protein [Chloroflexota bacterium]